MTRQRPDRHPAARAFPRKPSPRRHMDNSFKFFSNTACAYFPCHQGQDAGTFNCLFCYCPLYFLADCGGDFVLRRGVKDCAGCVRPHAPGGYEIILDRLRRECERRRAGVPPPVRP